jgi:hypothetical protein
MTRILLHSESISERGTSTAMFEYAVELKKLGYQVSLAYNFENPSNNADTLQLFSELCEVIPYRNFDTFKNIAHRSFDFAYHLKSGEDDGRLIPRIPNGVHVVFQKYQPHGDVYAYVSEWLAKTVARNQNVLLPRRIRRFIPNPKLNLPFVPHSVAMPAPERNVRSQYGIPQDAILGIRYGGLDTFDIPWVQEIVHKIVGSSPNHYFIFLNTRKFINHPQVKFAPAIVDKLEKSNYLSSSDFFLHGRSRGESFGMAILEATSLKVPVLAFVGGQDLNHRNLLLPSSLYKNSNSLLNKIMGIRMYSGIEDQYRLALEFQPEIVIRKFVSVFLT